MFTRAWFDLQLITEGEVPDEAMDIAVRDRQTSVSSSDVSVVNDPACPANDLQEKSIRRFAKTTPESPFVIADCMFRQQTDWLVEHSGASTKFKEIAHNLWFR